MKIINKNIHKGYIDEVNNLLIKNTHLIPRWVENVYLRASSDDCVRCDPDFAYCQFDLFIPEGWATFDDQYKSAAVIHEIAHLYTTPQVEALRGWLKFKDINPDEIDCYITTIVEHMTESLSITLATCQSDNRQ